MAFAKFDTDGSGSLDEEELANVLCMGSKLSKTEALEKAASIIRKYDFDGNGTLDVSFLGHATFHVHAYVHCAVPLLTHSVFSRLVLLACIGRRVYQMVDSSEDGQPYTTSTTTGTNSALNVL